MREAWIVVDLGFGDAGKGTITDFLVRDRGAGVVARFNGGAQAGHNVVTDDGRHHTFSQLGAGSFVPGVRTHLGPAFVLHPLALRVEAERLAREGVPDALARLSVDPGALVITPFQQAAGRLRELLRGPARHGSCGVGVGEAVGDALAHDDAIRAADLARPAVLAGKLASQQERKRALPRCDHPLAARERALIDDPGAVRRVVEAWRGLDPALRDDLPPADVVVFEGAQGVLLDERLGFHPHTTWSDCTFAGALAMIGGDAEVRRVGVTRAYATRHGPGPFPADGTLTVPEPHNAHDPWAGEFRTGALDLPLLRYAVDGCGGVDGLAVTHLDRVPDPTPLVVGYDPEIALVPGDLEHQERLGRRLAEVRPVIVTAPLRERLPAPVWIESRGPTASAKRWVR